MQTFAVTVTRRVDQIGSITIEAEDAAVADRLAASMFHSEAWCRSAQVGTARFPRPA